MNYFGYSLASKSSNLVKMKKEQNKENSINFFINSCLYARLNSSTFDIQPSLFCINNCTSDAIIKARQYFSPHFYRSKTHKSLRNLIEDSCNISLCVSSSWWRRIFFKRSNVSQRLMKWCLPSVFISTVECFQRLPLIFILQIIKMPCSMRCKYKFIIEFNLQFSRRIRK